jgi:dGTPase
MSGMVEIPFAATAPYACRPDRSRGRQVKEPPSPTRSPFQRDRDRIIHSGAFRRLKHKTQVFVFHEGDHFRTRLTHSLEVSQVARTIARVLGGNEDLAEAVALAHDLGHPPFGHVGERVLGAAMAGHGGFDHNAQTIRIVTMLERRYASFDGLNLSWEALEGLAKHNGPLIGRGRSEQDLPFAIRAYPQFRELELDQFAGLEAQIAAVSDDIAYINHDIDDGLRADLFNLDDLCEVAFIAETVKSVWNAYGGIDAARRTHETLRRLISAMIDDVIDETTRRLREIDPTSAAEIRAAGRPMVAFSEPTADIIQDIKTFLFARMYRSNRVNRTMAEAETIVRTLFKTYMNEPSALPPEWRGSGGAALSARARNIADFIAGMTDRFAVDEYERLSGREADFG